MKCILANAAITCQSTSFHSVSLGLSLPSDIDSLRVFSNQNQNQNL